MLLVFAFSSEQERDKFEYIFSKYKKLMLHKAYGILHDYMLAEDAASEAFIRIFKNIHKIDDPKSPRAIAFIVTIVKNTALTILKQNHISDIEPLDEQETDGFDLEEAVLSEMSSERIFTLLDGINEELKSVFLLKYAYDMQHKEIGEMLGITENNVTVRLHRARKALALILAGEGYVHE